MLAANYVVSKIADTNDGICDTDCSLREAITAANANAANDIITFAAAANGSVSPLKIAGRSVTCGNWIQPIILVSSMARLMMLVVLLGIVSLRQRRR